MKSVGEAMAIGRSFPEALMKALRSLERKESIFTFPREISEQKTSSLLNQISTPTEYRLQQVQQVLWAGISIDEVFEKTKIDRWFLTQIQLINDAAREIALPGEMTSSLMRTAKQWGFSDSQIALLRDSSEEEMRKNRIHLGVRPSTKL